MYKQSSDEQLVTDKTYKVYSDDKQEIRNDNAFMYIIQIDKYIFLLKSPPLLLA